MRSSRSSGTIASSVAPRPARRSARWPRAASAETAAQLLGGRSGSRLPRHRHPTARCPNGPPTANRPLTLPLMPKPSQIDLDLLLRPGHACARVCCTANGLLMAIDSPIRTSFAIQVKPPPLLAAASAE